jgi:hypothetical protein
LEQLIIGECPHDEGLVKKRAPRFLTKSSTETTEVLPATGRRDKFSWTKKGKKTQESQSVIVLGIDRPERLMLWRKTKFSFSAKSSRSHSLQSDLEDDGTEEAAPAAMPVDLICPDPLN